jgi:exopolysaccharide production protein ExoZ
MVLSHSKDLQSIQVLRGLAAGLVVLHHGARAVTVNWPSGSNEPTVHLFSSDRIVNLGAIGVDIFFVVSGLIMAHVSGPYLAKRKPSFDFLVRRIIRVYPMYALATVIFISFAALHFWFDPSRGYLPIRRGLASLAFIPTFDGNHLVQPVLGVGWTLYYEMFFYLCFTCVLSLSRGPILLPMIAIFCVTMGISWSFPGASPVLVFFRDTIIIEFVFGCSVGILLQKGWLSASIGWWALLITALALIAVAPVVEFGNELRFIYWGIPSAMIVASFLKLERIDIQWPRLAVAVGNSSYSLYLLHVIVIYELLASVRCLFAQLPGDAIVLVLSAIAACIGYLSFCFLERPLMLTLSAVYERQHFSNRNEFRHRK